MQSCLKSSSSSIRSKDEGEPFTLEVSFGRIEFREYPVIMGNNPSVSEGVPVTLDWCYDSSYAVDVENYEIATNKACRSTAGPRCPRLNVTVRAQILLSKGYKMKDIVGCTMDVLEEQQQRSDSVRNRKWDKVNHFMEVTKRAMKRKTSRQKIQELSLQSPPSPGVTDMPAPGAMHQASRRRSMETSRPTEFRSSIIAQKIRGMAPRRRSTCSEPQSRSWVIPQKIRGMAPRRRSNFQMDDPIINQFSAMTA